MHPSPKRLKRRYYGGRNLNRVLTIEELRRIAHRRVPNFAFEYVEGGAEDEATLRWNQEAFGAIRLVPRTLVDTSARHQRVTLFGRETSAPLVIAPTGLNGLLWHRADVALARAAAAAGIPFTLSTVSNVRLEEVAAEAGGRLWMQLYVMRDRAIARDIVARAERAGYEALVFTSDANVFGHREWDKRSYRALARLNWRNLLDVAQHPAWVRNVLVPHGFPRFENIVDYLPPEARTAVSGVGYVPKLFAPDISWDDVAWLRDAWPRKLILKGVLNVADAERAVELGCDGIVLTNHGGRQLDSCVAAVEVLPAIARAVGARTTVIVDGGFRRGTHVVKAMALGAHAVMLGRATLYGVAAAGEAGASRALAILTSEIDRVLGQLGCRSFAEVDESLLAPGTGTHAPVPRRAPASGPRASARRRETR
jgi:(S)-mandelate dehydrogenase